MNERKSLGCIIVHGFNSCTKDVEEVATYLNERGIYTASPCLTGENGSRKEWQSTSWKDWLSNAEKDFFTLQQICEKVVVIGYSMGGLVAMHLVQKYGADLLITISTPIYYADTKKILQNIRLGIKQRRYEPLKHYLHTLLTIPWNAAINFRKFLDTSVPLVDDISVPVLILQGLNDDIVQWRSADYIFNHVKSPIKKKIYYRNCDHGIFCGNQKEDVCEQIFHYIHTYSREQKKREQVSIQISSI